VVGGRWGEGWPRGRGWDDCIKGRGETTLSNEAVECYSLLLLNPADVCIGLVYVCAYACGIRRVYLQLFAATLLQTIYI
jgi:hypothetical protein